MKRKSKDAGAPPTMNAKQQEAAIKKADKKADPNSCALIVCIDQKTGLLKILKGQSCPPGYIKKVDEAMRVGVVFNPEIMDD